MKVRAYIVILLVFLFSLIVGCREGEKEVEDGTAVVAGLPTSLVTVSIPTPTLSEMIISRTPIYGAGTASPVPTVTKIPTATPVPTATPLAAERLGLGQLALARGNYELAERHLAAGIGSFSGEEQADFYFELGKVAYEVGDLVGAREAWDQYVQFVGDAAVPELHFYLGDLADKEGDCSKAIEQYDLYLAKVEEMGLYIQPRIGDCWIMLGERLLGIDAYQLGIESGGDYRVQLREMGRLGSFYYEEALYLEAAQLYERAFELARTERMKGRMAYQAGAAWVLAGEEEKGVDWYRTAVFSYPRAYESYLALVQLIERGEEIDLFQRGMVDYYGGQYELTINLFYQYLQDNEIHDEEAHLYIAWSYEQLGNINLAVGEIDRMLETDGLSGDIAARGLLEKGKLLARVGWWEESSEAYDQLVTRYPTVAEAPFAAWWAAAYQERIGHYDVAEERYVRLAELYGWHIDAPEAWYRAGWMATFQEEEGRGIAYWYEAISAYPDNQYAHAALIQLWENQEYLLFSGDGVTESLPLIREPLLVGDYLKGVEVEEGEAYYTLRVRQMMEGGRPFESEKGVDFRDKRSEKLVAESWLRKQVGISLTVPIDQLSTEILGDERFLIGSHLWAIGLKEEAKQEFEQVRQAYDEDLISSYQLALYFREIGLYRSSILAGRVVIDLSGEDIFSVPPYIGKLVYPIYYADLIVPLAIGYQYDPLLQFALVRQESLFESFATSGAAAKGLSQVIPDTGDYIARLLSWEGYETADLYRPYVGLEFGAFYLAQQLRTFDGQVYPALAAYNGGPGNALRWYNQAGDDPDYYLETVNFAETRAYIERIFVGYEIYQYLYR